MSCKVMYTCDHCGAKCKGDEYASTGRWDEPGIIVFGKTVHGCSREHLGIALAKMFGISINGEADELLNRKQRELTKLADANSFLVTEHDNMRARIAELEARMPANEVTNVERAQYDRTIELQRKRIEELETSEAALTERLTRIEGPAQRLVDIDNNLAEGRDVAAKALFHDSVMRPIEELRGYFGNVARAEKRGQTIFEWEVERRKRVEKSRDELQARVAELEKRIAGLTAPVTVDNTSPSLDNLAKKLVSVFDQAYKEGPNDQRASVRAGIRAVLAALPMPITQPVTVDGKTPGQVALEAWNPEANGYSAYRDDWERSALAVLRAFGQPSQTTQDAAEALERVRDRIATECSIGVDPLISKHAARGIINDELAKLGMEKPASEVPFCFLCGKGPHDHEMMVLESLPKQFEVQWCNGKRQNFGTEKPHWWDKPTSDHVHELGSCSFCDKSPPDTSTESGLPDAVLAAITLPTKPTKPLRARLEELATYWETGAASSSMSEGYRQASKDCAKELREVIDDPR